LLGSELVGAPRPPSSRPLSASSPRRRTASPRQVRRSEPTVCPAEAAVAREATIQCFEVTANTIAWMGDSPAASAALAARPALGGSSRLATASGAGPRPLAERLRVAAPPPRPGSLPPRPATAGHEVEERCITTSAFAPNAGFAAATAKATGPLAPWDVPAEGPAMAPFAPWDEPTAGHTTYGGSFAADAFVVELHRSLVATGERVAALEEQLADSTRRHKELSQALVSCTSEQGSAASRALELATQAHQQWSSYQGRTDERLLAYEAESKQLREELASSATWQQTCQGDLESRLSKLEWQGSQKETLGELEHRCASLEQVQQQMLEARFPTLEARCGELHEVHRQVLESRLPTVEARCGELHEAFERALGDVERSWTELASSQQVEVEKQVKALEERCAAMEASQQHSLETLALQGKAHEQRCQNLSSTLEAKQHGMVFAQQEQLGAVAVQQGVLVQRTDESKARHDDFERKVSERLEALASELERDRLHTLAVGAEQLKEQVQTAVASTFAEQVPLLESRLASNLAASSKEAEDCLRATLLELSQQMQPSTPLVKAKFQVHCGPRRPGGGEGAGGGGVAGGGGGGAATLWTSAQSPSPAGGASADASEAPASTVTPVADDSTPAVMKVRISRP